MSDRLCTSHFSVQYTRTQKCLNFGYFIEPVFYRRRPLYWDAGAWIGMIKQAHTIQYTMSITTLKRERAAYICHQHLTISQECSKNKTFTSVLSLLSGAYLRSFILFFVTLGLFVAAVICHLLKIFTNCRIILWALVQQDHYYCSWVAGSRTRLPEWKTRSVRSFIVS